MEERPISREEMLRHPSLGSFQLGGFDAPRQRGVTLWFSPTEGWIVKGVPHDRGSRRHRHFVVTCRHFAPERSADQHQIEVFRIAEENARLQGTPSVPSPPGAGGSGPGQGGAAYEGGDGNGNEGGSSQARGWNALQRLSRGLVATSRGFRARR